MSPTHEIATAEASATNSRYEIEKRLAAGRVLWTGPLVLVCARSVIWLSLQSGLALVLLVLHRPEPFRSAGQWWPLYANLGDLGCLIGLRYFTGQEGIRLRDLIGPIRMRWGRDLWLGLGILAVSYPLCMVGAHFAGILVYGSSAGVPMEFLLQKHALPLWATIYSLTVWWVIQSATEEMTYQAYVLPRLQALTGRTWMAMAITGFWWAGQHCMFPFVADWRYLAFHFLIFVPLVLVWMPVYLRMRRLSPFVIAHWPMDLLIAVMTGVR
jgi:hypothetical protein